MGVRAAYLTSILCILSGCIGEKLLSDQVFFCADDFDCKSGYRCDLRSNRCVTEMEWTELDSNVVVGTAIGSDGSLILLDASVPSDAMGDAETDEDMATLSMSDANADVLGNRMVDARVELDQSVSAEDGPLRMALDESRDEAAMHCQNGVLDPDEADVDCGGSCRGCMAGLRCTVAEDCESGVCVDERCLEGRCGDGVIQEDETCDDGNSDDDDQCTTDCREPRCGDGIVQPETEQCDDGNSVDTDMCRNNCALARCGDGVVQEGQEECDDGNIIQTDDCTNLCELATCGDGLVRAGFEDCDDGNTSNDDYCTDSCIYARCGDGLLWQGVEQCDDANGDNTDGCLNTCRLARCGDGFVHAARETCDDGNTAREVCNYGSLSCEICGSTCQIEAGATRYCGNGVSDPEEECDDQNSEDGDSCTNACTLARCGDGAVRLGVEECDDGNTVETDACPSTCKVARCGDGFVQASSENCDDGNIVLEACPYGSRGCEVCGPDCQLLPGTTSFCGDGRVDADETCDDENMDDGDACTNDCQVARCGDGIVQVGVEKCDDGNQIDTDECLSNCMTARCGDNVVLQGVETCDDGNRVLERCPGGVQPCEVCGPECTLAPGRFCGDGIVDPEEQCDDQNDEDGDSCTNACTLARCGDGALRSDVEECDDGNTVDTDACPSTCKVARCGDGFVHASSESCDDGNTILEVCPYGSRGCEVCGADCQLQPGKTSFCGDGEVDVGETCDDENMDDGDACTNDCQVARCGDGIVHVGVEKCDDGNQIDTDECLSTCMPAKCGDAAILDGVETCDDGNRLVERCANPLEPCEVCGSECRLGPGRYCGDGVVDPEEACDHGGVNSLDCDYGDVECTVCAPDCNLVNGNVRRCGDAITDPEEGCDDGNTITERCPTGGQSCEVCGADCTRQAGLSASCGDWHLDSGEECDDGNIVPNDGCDEKCRFEATCGNGIVEPGEACDLPVALNAELGFLCTANCESSALAMTVPQEFQTCGETGSVGPTQSDCDAVYNRDVLFVWDGFQIFLVPKTGIYEIIARGAQGGRMGGKGAEVGGRFYLKRGDVLSILVGQMGETRGSTGGGGGGTFVERIDANTNTSALLRTLLLAAGGGGGGHGVIGIPAPEQNGQPTTRGADASGVVATVTNMPGDNGAAATGQIGAGHGGCGYLSSFGGETVINSARVGENTGDIYCRSVRDGGRGGLSNGFEFAGGGFGGGGSGDDGSSGDSAVDLKGGGGGGGFSGGAGGAADVGWSSGGGGGSFVSDEAIADFMTLGAAGGQGTVSFAFLGENESDLPPNDFGCPFQLTCAPECRRIEDAGGCSYCECGMGFSNDDALNCFRDETGAQDVILINANPQICAGMLMAANNDLEALGSQHCDPPYKAKVSACGCACIAQN